MFKSKATKILLGILIVLVLVLGGLEVKSILDARNKKPVAKVTTKMVGPYYINNTQTEYQKELEPLLSSAIDTANGKNIVTEVSKYFISDFFTLRDKSSSNNVGGMGFVFPSTQGSFKTNAIDAYYVNIANYIQDYKQENLPLVTKVEVGTPKKSSKAKAGITGDDAKKVKLVYDVDVSWTYEENEKLDPSQINLVNKITITYVQDTDKNWWVYSLGSQ